MVIEVKFNKFNKKLNFWLLSEAEAVAERSRSIPNIVDFFICKTG
jgi:hypothetical protein